jgi:predicted nucleic acid-binding Zn ribbon protein
MENRCVVCGAVIPEGRWVCPLCEKGELPLWKNGKSQKTGVCKG